MQGECRGAPQLQLQAPPLAELREGQCVIVADMTVWEVRFGPVWMHNLYLRHSPTARSDSVSLVTSTEASGRLWLTQMTLQGAAPYADGVGAQGLVAGGPTYIEGALLASLRHALCKAVMSYKMRVRHVVRRQVLLCQDVLACCPVTTGQPASARSWPLCTSTHSCWLTSRRFHAHHIQHLGPKS